MAIASLKDMQQIILTEKKTGIFPERTKVGKVAVIGAGPSGLQAALELRKEGCQGYRI